MNTGDANEPSLTRNFTGLQNPAYAAAFLDLAFDAVIAFDARERITYWNPAAEQLYGWTAQEALGKTPAKLFWHADTTQEKKDRRQRLLRLKRGETLRGEHSLCNKDGSSLFVQYSTRAVFDAAGKVSGYLAVHHDISAQAPGKIDESDQHVASLNMEESLRARTEEIETLLKVSPVAVFVAHDPECVRITANPAGYRLVGLPENPELNISKSAPAHERPTYRTFRNEVEVPTEDLPMQKAARLGVEVSEDELELRFEDGSRKFIYAFAMPLFDAQGRSRGAIATMLDITVRKQSEDALRASEERYRAVIDTALDAIVVTNPSQEGRVLSANPAACNMFGYRKKEFIGLKRQDMLDISDSNIAAFLAERRQFGRVSKEVIYKRKDGTRFTGELSSVLYQDENGEQRAVAIIRDITVRKYVEKQLERSNQRLNQILESIQDDFYVLDHDWNFVFTSRSFTSRIRKEPEDFIGNNIWKMFPKHVGTVLEENFRSAMEKREIRRFEIPGKYTNAWYRMTVFPSAEGITILGTDITERKRAEEALREAQLDLERAQEVGQTGSWRLDIRQNVLTWSRETYHIFGVPVGTPMSYESFLRLVHPDDRQYVELQWSAGLTGAPYDIEHRIVVDGGVKWVREKAYLEFDDVGSLLGGFGISQDITHRKQAEEALRESEERLRRMIETSPVAIRFSDSKGRIFDANHAFYRLTGYSREEIQSLQLGWDQLTAPGYTELDRQVLATLEATGSAGPYEKEYIRKDGSRVPLLLTISKLPGGDEHIAFIMDITAHKRTEEFLAQALHELHAHINNSPLAIILFDREFRIKEWSAGAERMFGWQAGEVLNKTIAELRWVHEDDMQRVASLSADMLAGRAPSNVHANRNYRKNGSVIECEWYNSAVLDASGKLISVRAQVLDVTERKRAEVALRENEKQLQLLNETLEQKVHEKTVEVRHLAADLVKAVQRERHRISHILHDDLQQRIYAIRMQLSFLQDDLQRNETALKDVFDIEGQLDEILMVTRHLSIDLSPPILHDEGLSHAINWLATQMKQRYGLPIELQADGPFAIADEELHVLLFNCVRELLFNVVKHANASQVVVTLGWSDSNLQIEVRDNGKGFPLDQPEQPVSEEINGEDDLNSSLGLPTIRHQLNLFGGQIEIHSEPGAGSRVILIVPVTVEE